MMSRAEIDRHVAGILALRRGPRIARGYDFGRTFGERTVTLPNADYGAVDHVFATRQLGFAGTRGRQRR